MLRNTSLHVRSSGFNLNLLELPKLERIDGAIRLYETPTGERYPSVTTVLSAMEDKTHLDEWRQRVGDEEADLTMRRASTRGTNIHDMLERYVLGEEIDVSMPSNRMVFNQVRRVLDTRIGAVRAVESQLFSHKLKIAGTCDLVAEFDGRLSIIDYKTSAREKHKDMIEGYFLQTSLYSYMLWEMIGLPALDIVVIIGSDDTNEALIFQEKSKNYISKASQMVKDYHNGCLPRR